MSNLITEAFVQQYRSNVQHLYQQKGSKLRGTTRAVTVNAKRHYFERLGATAAVKKTVRHSDTPLVNSQHSRRMVEMTDYEWADLVDQTDKIRMLISPESEYAMNAASAFGRAYDDAIIEAFAATAYSGETGGTAVAFDSSDQAGDVDNASAALTTTIVLNAKTALDVKEVPSGDRFFLLSPEYMNQLLVGTTIPASSSDYNTIKAMVQGDVDTWCGFRFITTNRLPLAVATEYYSFAWHKDSMGVAMGKDFGARIIERADKSFSTQVYTSASFGATRIDGNGVYRLQLDDDA